MAECADMIEGPSRMNDSRLRKDKPLQKLKEKDRELIGLAVLSIENNDIVTLRRLLPCLVEQNLLNYSRVHPLDNTLLNRALSPSKKNIAAATELISAGADIESTDYQRVTPLMKAASFNLDTTVTLLRAGANANASDTFGLTPLHHSAANQWAGVEILSALLDAGAEINVRDNTGRTPLHSAVGVIDSIKVKFLLDRGADPVAQAHGSLGTPLQYLANTVKDLPSTKPGQRQQCLTLLSSSGQ